MSYAAFGPQIKRTGIPDALVTRFKDLIQRRVFRAGEKLPPERELAIALGVSRPTLRQATKALQILGVIRCRQGDGSYLTESSPDVLKEPLEFALALQGVLQEDLLEMRITLEVKLASLAAERRTEEDLDGMRVALQGMKDSMRQAEPWCSYELRFHETIVLAAKNAVMTSVMEMLSRMLLESRRETVLSLLDYEESYRSHEDIFIEIEGQDPGRASEKMIRHFAILRARPGGPGSQTASV